MAPVPNRDDTNKSADVIGNIHVPNLVINTNDSDSEDEADAHGYQLLPQSENEALQNINSDDEDEDVAIQNPSNNNVITLDSAIIQTLDDDDFSNAVANSVRFKPYHFLDLVAL